jgi:hypothetical protein
VKKMNDEIQVDLMLRDSGSMKATADVILATAIGPETIFGVKVIETNPGKPWISLPAKEYQAGGQRRFQKVLELSKPGMKALSLAVLKVYEEKLKAA